ncbi:hypothetical protein K457DRAFT_24050 [Linnemannia elongata AG-77]|uniref:Uncharacterized protein n=1 Tax=Linnemannia elongata AG-77 TaxID=1314771 RepID=A0A197JH25_9FUNG|nr:hypothetical protein K457DRAFT_24050 [Linnemannia elongata AG-77]
MIILQDYAVLVVGDYDTWGRCIDSVPDDDGDDDAGVVTADVKECSPMGEEPAGCQLLREKVPPEELQSLVPDALSTDNRVSTSHGDRDNDDYNINSTSASDYEKERDMESREFNLLRPVLLLLNEKITSLEQEKQELEARNQQLQDQLDAATRTITVPSPSPTPTPIPTSIPTSPIPFPSTPPPAFKDPEPDSRSFSPSIT